ncbi:MAG TPA: DUF6036 family nucleotidyltransferase [Hydrogenophaga sp.]|uniref:DUF6036 family nucleotidyltransferase n=1 Tax=Hydrogenophaga sp. TaxID=1904254 RepID=UPI002BBA06CF|nr:DUF6036 family nucleotidyltransferase [Hydrogenophaga sp.]HSX91593.1 DUF6036 family nucleotidyltransferase [Hydrogenophaga sp.]
MNRAHLFTLFEQAHTLTGHRDFVVIGSLSILGSDDEGGVPAEMSMSIDIDCYTKADPGRINDVRATLGEGSDFHRAHGYYLDPVSPSLPSLPDGWEVRMTVIERDGLRVWFLDPDDAAISKYARSQANDLRWIRAGLLSGHVSLPRVRSRLGSTLFLDDEEAARVREQIERDSAWFESVRRPHGGGIA